MAKKEKKQIKVEKPAEKPPVKPPVKPPEKRPTKSKTKAPAEYVFWCHDGCTFADLKELADGLQAMSDETFAYHSNREKQDFANWVRDIIEDEWLAEELARASNRLQAAMYVSARMTLPASR